MPSLHNKPGYTSPSVTRRNEVYDQLTLLYKERNKTGDLIILLGNAEFRTHKAVFMHHCRFRDGDRYVSTAEGLDKIILKDVSDPIVFRHLLRYIYTGSYDENDMMSGSPDEKKDAKNTNTKTTDTKCPGSEQKLNKSCDRGNSDHHIKPPRPSTPHGRLLLAVRLYKMANEFGVNSLRYLCMDRFHSAAMGNDWHKLDNFPNVVDELYSAVNLEIGDNNNLVTLHNVIETVVADKICFDKGVQKMMDDLMKKHRVLAVGVKHRVREQMAQLQPKDSNSKEVWGPFSHNFATSCHLSRPFAHMCYPEPFGVYPLAGYHPSSPYYTKPGPPKDSGKRA
ncbi:hypothetical protein QBC43DRAFT_284030 [Cladorrhinum sp. PSN259]|nr:hypothetical protein QBC43DRAFT_284030 [Cladorrhinum sp. PSN259]